MSAKNKFRMTCPECGSKYRVPANLLGKTCKCPKCAEPVLMQSDEDTSVEDAAMASAPPPVPSTSMAPPSEDGIDISTFPERMRANKAISGRICPGCMVVIELGDDVYNCHRCNETSHASCYTDAGQCPSRVCTSNVAPQSAAAVAPAQSAGIKECPSCGEEIKAQAKRCRFCKSAVDPRVRAREMQRQKEKEAANDKLTVGEIILSILCSGIACIVGLVWAIQGKKKGWKMMGIALCVQIVFTILKVLARMSR